MRRVCFVAFLALVLGIIACSRPEVILTTLDEARAAYGKGHFTEAERLYERYLQTEPNGKDRWEAWNRLLDIARNVLADNDRAVALLDSMFLEFGEDSSKSWDLLAALAASNEALHRWPEAVDDWKRCLNLPNLDRARTPEIYLRLARLYRVQREYDLTQQSLKLCLEQSPTPEIKVECLYEWAQTLDYVHKRAQAQSAESAKGKTAYDPTNNLEQMKQRLEELLRLNAGTTERRAQAAFLLAEVYEGLGKKTEALRTLQSILTTYPNPKVVEARIESLRGGKKKE